MKRLFHYITLAVMIIGITSCDNDSKEDNKVKKPEVTTISAEQKSLFTVSLSGQVKGLEGVASDYECGIEYSTDEIFSNARTKKIKASVGYTENVFTVNSTIIYPNQQYYYRAYYINQQLTYYGDVKTFSLDLAKPEVITLDAVVGDDNVVTLKGVIKGFSTIFKELYNNTQHYDEYLWCGFEYSTNERLENVRESNVLEYEPKLNALNDTIVCNVSINDKGVYYYRTFFEIPSIYSVGSIKSFEVTGGWNPSLLIGRWRASEWSYTFNNDKTGLRTTGGINQSFTWSLSDNELELEFQSASMSPIRVYVIFIITSLSSDTMEVYDKDDSTKEIITFTKKR